MRALHPTRTSRLLLGLACCLALLAPAGAAAWSPPGATGPRSLAEGTDGPGQGHLRDPMAAPVAAPGNRRDDRERLGPALPGLLAAVVPVAAGVAARWAVRATRRRSSAAAGARAPPALQPPPS